ncbi:MAG TPA: FAD-binding protein, partial [Rhodobacteraceae bacterium]|nr:FAD-binding protein [Paracoccaceae bacterium]
MLDVIVIGGGISGLTAAHELMGAGLDVALL